MLFKKNILLIFTIILLFTVATSLAWEFAENKLKNNFLTQAAIIAKSINVKRLSNLTGTIKDINSNDYIRIKQQLKDIRKANKYCRFLYLMGQNKNNEIFFYLDSQPKNSNSYVYPGFIYEEVSKEYLNVFKNKKAAVVGPIKDRWGTLVTSLIPIYHPETNQLLAVLGMDINADKWYKEIFKNFIPSLSLILITTIILLFLLYINNLRKNLKKQYEKTKKLYLELQNSLTRTKKLEGLLPICSNCKSIRDNKGNWKAIDSYIQEHSEAEITHGLCPNCAKKLYPKFFK